MLRAGRVSYLRLGLEVIRESFLRRWPFTQVLINHRSWAPRRGWEGCFRWLEQYEPKPAGGERLGWVQEAEDRCGWGVVSSLGSLSWTVRKVGWSKAQGLCVPGHAVQACPGGDGEPWKVGE